jgi:hypothetical protein
MVGLSKECGGVFERRGREGFAEIAKGIQKIQKNSTKHQIEVTR